MFSKESSKIGKLVVQFFAKYVILKKTKWRAAYVPAIGRPAAAHNLG